MKAFWRAFRFLNPGVSGWLSRLWMWSCPCCGLGCYCGTGLIPDLELLHALAVAKKILNLFSGAWVYIYSFNKHLIEHPLCVRHCSRHQRNSSDRDSVFPSVIEFTSVGITDDQDNKCFI